MSNPNDSMLRAATNRWLLDTFTLLVQTDHYDPHETPAKVVELRKREITQEAVRAEIERRMGWS